MGMRLLLVFAGVGLVAAVHQTNVSITTSVGCYFCPSELAAGLDANSQIQTSDVCRIADAADGGGGFDYESLRSDLHHCACTSEPRRGGAYAQSDKFAAHVFRLLDDATCNVIFHRSVCGFFKTQDYTFTTRRGFEYTVAKGKEGAAQSSEYSPFVRDTYLQFGTLYPANGGPNGEQPRAKADTTNSGDVVYDPAIHSRMNYTCGSCVVDETNAWTEGYTFFFDNPEDLGCADFPDEGGSSSIGQRCIGRGDQYHYVQHGVIAGWNTDPRATISAYDPEATTKSFRVDIEVFRRRVTGVHGCVIDPCFDAEGWDLCFDQHRLPCNNDETLLRDYDPSAAADQGYPLINAFGMVGGGDPTLSYLGGPLIQYANDEGLYPPEGSYVGSNNIGTPVTDRRRNRVHCGQCFCGWGPQVVLTGYVGATKTDQLDNVDNFPAYNASQLGLKGSNGGRDGVYGIWRDAPLLCGEVDNIICSVRNCDEAPPPGSPDELQYPSECCIRGGTMSTVILRGSDLHPVDANGQGGDYVVFTPGRFSANPQPHCSVLNEQLAAGEHTGPSDLVCDNSTNCFSTAFGIHACNAAGTECTVQTDLADANWGNETFMCLWDSRNLRWKSTGEGPIETGGSWPLCVLPPPKPKPCDLVDQPPVLPCGMSEAIVRDTWVSVSPVIGDIWIGSPPTIVRDENNQVTGRVPDPYRVRVRVNAFSEFTIDPHMPGKDDDDDDDDYYYRRIVRSTGNYWHMRDPDDDDDDDDEMAVDGGVVTDGGDDDDYCADPHKEHVHVIGHLNMSDDLWHPIPHPWDEGVQDTTEMCEDGTIKLSVDTNSRPARGYSPGGHLAPEWYPGHWDVYGPANCSYPGSAPPCATWVWRLDRSHLLHKCNLTHETSNSSVYVWLFQKDCVIQEGDHEIHVKAGDVKYRVQTFDYPFCEAAIGMGNMTDYPEGFNWCPNGDDDDDDDDEEVDQCPHSHDVGKGLAFEIETDRGVPTDDDDNDDSPLSRAAIEGKGRRLLMDNDDDDNGDLMPCPDEGYMKDYHWCTPIAHGIVHITPNQSFAGQPRNPRDLVSANDGEWMPTQWNVIHRPHQDFDVYMRKHNREAAELDTCGNPTVAEAMTEPSHWYDGTIRVQPTPGDWGKWSVCSALCGMGTRTRACDSPPPRFGGADCEGLAEEACPAPNPCGDKPKKGSLVIKQAFEGVDVSEFDEASFLQTLMDLLFLDANKFGPVTIKEHKDGAFTVQTYIPCSKSPPTFDCMEYLDELEDYNVKKAALEALSQAEYNGVLAGRAVGGVSVDMDLATRPIMLSPDVATTPMYIGVGVGVAVAVALIVVGAFVYNKKRQEGAKTAEDLVPAVAVEEIGIAV